MIIFWFKRDLRIEDIEALKLACNQNEPLLLLYVLEPALIKNAHTSERHLSFIKESLTDLNNQLEAFGTTILLVKDEVEPVFEYLFQHRTISTVYSTQEIGIDITYRRDMDMAKWISKRDITWIETQYNGVKRGLKDREGWSYAWKKYMTAPLSSPYPIKDWTEERNKFLKVSTTIFGMLTWNLLFILRVPELLTFRSCLCHWLNV